MSGSRYYGKTNQGEYASRRRSGEGILRPEGETTRTEEANCV
jgi:hypothetical protein